MSDDGSSPVADRVEQLAEEFFALLKQGKRPSVESFVARVPQEGERLREILSCALMLEDHVGPASTAEVHAEIGGHRIVRELGRGGMGVVFEADDRSLGRRVAIKVMDARALRRPEQVRRFQREAAIASRIDHPAICTVYSSGVENDIPYMEMQLIAGETLGKRIGSARRRTDPEPSSVNEESTVGAHEWSIGTRGDVMAIVALVEKVARGIHAAHELGIVHRDVKPGNIMVTPDGEPVLLDFGLARDVDSGDDLTRTGEAFGTLPYMSPEQLDTDGSAVAPSSDIYGLGVTLYECLTLERPFSAATREQLLVQIIEGRAADPRALNPAVPRDLAVVVSTAMQADRTRRYASAELFADDLRRVRCLEPIAARLPSPVSRAIKWARRKPAHALLLVMLVLSAAMAGYIVAQWPAIRAKSDRDRLALVEAGLEYGFSAMEHGDPARAADRLRDALRLDPGNVEATAGLAYALLRQGETDDVIALLDSCPQDVVDRPAFRHIRRLALQDPVDDNAETVRPESALGFFLQGLQRMSTAHRTMDRAQFRLARDAFREAALLAKTARPLYHYSLAHAAAHVGDRDECGSISSALTTLWPTSSWALFFAAFAVKDIDSERAETLYSRSLERDPTNPNVRHFLGRLLMRSGDIESAEVHLREAVALSSDFAPYRDALGKALLKLARFDEAISEHRRAVELRPDQAGYVANLGAALTEAERLSDAVALHRAFSRQHPESAEIWCNLGLILRRVGLYEESLRALLEGHRHGAGRGSSWGFPSKVWVDRARELVEAEKRVTEIVGGRRKRPEDPDRLLDLARVAAGTHRSVLAVEWFTEVFARRPSSHNSGSPSNGFVAASAAVHAAGLPGATGEERAARRALARDWLSQRLTSIEERLDRGRIRPTVAVRSVRRWQLSGAFATVRADAVQRLPAPERQQWNKLWTDVAELIDWAGSEDR